MDSKTKHNMGKQNIESFQPCSWQSPSLYIGDLDLTVQEEDLEKVFSKYGEIDSIKVCKNWTTGAPLGYGFINYNTVDSAQKALESYNYCPIKGKPCRLMWSTKRSIGTTREDEAANVYVKGLPKSMDNRGLHELFSQCGVVLSAKVATNSLGTSLGYGYVSFTKQCFANKAMRDLHKTKVGHMKISVEPFVEKRKRHPSKADTIVAVNSIPRNLHEDFLIARFSVYGRIQSVSIERDIYGISKGFGFVDFESSHSAKLAVQDNLNPFIPASIGADPIFNFPLKVSLSSPKSVQSVVGRPLSRNSLNSGGDFSTTAASDVNFELEMNADLLGWNAFEQQYGLYKGKKENVNFETSINEIESFLADFNVSPKEQNIFEFVNESLEA